MSADVVDGQDVGVVEGGDGVGFLLEALEAVGVRGDVVREDLEGDVAPEPGVPRAVDRPHAAGPEKLGDLVRPETGSGRERHSLPPRERVRATIDLDRLEPSSLFRSPAGKEPAKPGNPARTAPASQMPERTSRALQSQSKNLRVCPSADSWRRPKRQIVSTATEAQP